MQASEIGADWLEILKQRVEDKGQAAVSRELGFSRATVSQICGGKYGASTANVEARVLALYSRNGRVACPVLGEIGATECTEHYGRAREYGNRATGNPETLRLYLHCRKMCPVRGN